MRHVPAPHSLFSISSWRPGTAVPSEALVVLGVPYAGASFLRSAASSGPDAIRHQSPRVCSCRPLPDSSCVKPLYSPAHDSIVLDDIPLLDAGNLVPEEESPEQVAEELARWAAARLAQGSTPLILGGDHSISYGMAIANASTHATGVIYLDAHLDASPVPGGPLTHGTWAGLARALPNVECVAQIGLRSHQPVPHSFVGQGSHEPNASGGTAAFRDWGVDSLLPASRLQPDSLIRFLDSLPKHLAWHLSVDVDVLDPLFMPCTGMPLPLGLEPRTLAEVLRQAMHALHIKSMDVTEYAPEGDRDSELAGLTLAGVLAEVLPDLLRSGT